MRGRPKTFDREEVLQKAIELFWRQGFEATGLAELTREMGIGRQSLYNTFGDKRTLFLAALEQYSAQQIGAFQEILEQPGSVIENIRQVFAMWKEMSQDEISCGCLVGNSAAELGSLDADVAALTRRQLRRMEKAFQAVLERGQATGEVPGTLEPKSMARLMLSASQGLALLSKIEIEGDVIDDVLRTIEKLISQPATSKSRTLPPAEVN